MIDDEKCATWIPQDTLVPDNICITSPTEDILFLLFPYFFFSHKKHIDTVANCAKLFNNKSADMEY